MRGAVAIGRSCASWPRWCALRSRTRGNWWPTARLGIRHATAPDVPMLRCHCSSLGNQLVATTAVFARANSGAAGNTIGRSRTMS
jgi:hypothetical protein